MLYCVHRCSPEKPLFAFFAVYVGLGEAASAVIAHKIDGLAGADPSMPLSNSRERSHTSLFSRTQGVRFTVKLSLFQQIQGHASHIMILTI